MENQDVLQGKLQKLKDILVSYGSVAVAFSGGVDSTLLLSVAHEVCGERAFAITSVGCVNPARESDEALDFCQEQGIRQMVITHDQLSIPGFAQNTPDRCYVCKKALFGEFLPLAKKHGAVLVEGRNLDDDGDFRPGTRAIQELGVASPLHAAGLTKADIRQLSAQRGLPTWDKPSYACMASRFPYGTAITAEGLAQVDKGEQYLLDLGFKQIRLRLHGDVARIEAAPEEMDGLYQASKAPGFTEYFRSLGFKFVTLDLDGYRTGSMNATMEAPRE